ncbi:MAG: thioredoxin domain-containing protein [Candidatus Schmidhempelia sp.]|nr:thioredoxin domain-containing protein [Candidatus Schmidhempelia sp.]
MSLKLPVTQRDHSQGHYQATIELVEYGDYQCGYCGEFYYIVKKLQQHFGEKIRFVFRNFPLEAHPNALHAALAAEAMTKYNKYWPMHDILYENQQALDDFSLIEYAKTLGIEEEQFRKDYNDPSLMEKIQQDVESGLRSGVNGTPSIYINGKKYEQDYSYDYLVKYIEKLL